jgi:hypothetical protein
MRLFTYGICNNAVYICMYVCTFARRLRLYYSCHQLFSIYAKTRTVFIRIPWGANSNNAHYVHCYVLLFKNPLLLLPVSSAFLSEVCPGFGQLRQAESEVLFKQLILTTKIVSQESVALIEGVQD